MSKHRALMEVILYEFTGAELAHLNGLNKCDRHTDRLLPDFCLHNGKVSDTDHVYQFFTNPEFLPEADKVEKILLFDVRAVSNVLSEEFSNDGKDNLINDYMIENFIEILTNHCHKMKYEEFGRTMPTENFMVVELNYMRSYDNHSDGYEYDMEAELIGYLDDQMMLCNPNGTPII